MVCDEENGVDGKALCERLCTSTTPATQGEGGCDRVPRLPRQSVAASPATKTGPSAPPEPAQCNKCHACHAKRRWMWPSATPATRNEGGCHQVPRLPRKVPRCHRRLKPVQAHRQSQPSAISATPATQSDGRGQEVPRLPRKVTVEVTKCHACHAKQRWMWPSTMLATRNEGGCHQVPCLPRKVPRRHRRLKLPQVRHQSQPSANKCHACHAKRRWMSPSATPAMRNEGGCHQVPRLPRKLCER